MSTWMMFAWAAIPILIWIGYSKEARLTFKEVFILGLIFGGIAGVSLWFDHWLGDTVFWIIFAMAALVAISPDNVDADQETSSPDSITKYQSSSTGHSAVNPLKKGRLPKSSQKSKSYSTAKQVNQPKSSSKSLRSSKTPKHTSYSRGEVRQIAFDYIDSTGNFTSREVAVNSLDGSYLNAYCLEKGATRTFKLENICGLITLRETGELLSVHEWEDIWRAA
ncbi:hypothetical protein G3479_15560 [Shewanella baltica]|uniref:hypothetical protein n=1 Tax=Shewanella baltica TaxID=62322 RepID=UPI00217D6BED|nr:hypothetical protein [Shewanella baltica]MCS6260652.1 hypothetical protein [Shewanella baltica]